MQLFQLIGIAFVTAIVSIVLKSTKPELSFAVSVTGGIILLLFTFDYLKDSFSVFTELTKMTGVDSALVKVLLKMLGIGYLVEFSCGVLNDFGQGALADKLALCGKLTLFLLAVPILQNVLALMKQLLEIV